jgi:iron-sulfur cluster repair protein YtfE (RIC family)
VFDDLIRTHPAATLAIIVLLWSLLAVAAKRIVGRLDTDVRDLRDRYRGIRKEVSDVKTELRVAQAEAKASRHETAEHMKREETIIWPAIQKAMDAAGAVHSRLDKMHETDIAAHAVLGERVARVEALIRNGGK